MKKIIWLTNKLLFKYLFISCCLIINITYGNILTVPSEYPTIQKAIDAAGKGDTVYVLNGVYNYTEIQLKSFISIIGQDNQNTIIDGNGIGNAFTGDDAEGVYIENFKIVNCYSAIHYYYNAGAFKGNISIAIRNNNIGNMSNYAVIMYWNSYSNKAIVDNNIFRNCYSAVYTGRADQSVVISNNFIYGCYTGLTLETYSNPVIINNVVARSKTNGIYVSAGNAKILNNTLVYNGEAGIYITHNKMLIRNNISCFNGTGISDYSSGTIGDYNNIFGNRVNYGIPKGDHDISYDPLFTDTLTYRLSPNSPCIDAGDPFSDYDFEPNYNGGRINLGAYGNTDKAQISNPEITLSGDIYLDTLTTGQTDTAEVWVSNTGLTRLIIKSVSVSSNKFSLITDEQDFILPNDSINIKVVFKPDIVGIFNAELSILSNDEDESIFTIPLTGVCDYPGAPLILKVSDVPNDQGRWVKLDFSKSIYDTDTLIIGKVSSAQFYSVEIDDGSGWMAAAVTAAYGKPLYSVLVPTTMDSTDSSDGVLNFRVIAAMDEGNFAGNIVQGYSIDNLFPSIPSGLQASVQGGGIRLVWNSGKDADFRYYTIYRGASEGKYQEIGTTIDSTFLDTDLEPGITYVYAVTATDFSGNESGFSTGAQIIFASINTRDSGTPVDYSLLQNYPNPFNPSTSISFSIAEQGFVTLKVYDVLGREAATLVNEELTAGNHNIIFNASGFSSGIYLYTLSSGEFISTQKMILIK